MHPIAQGRHRWKAASVCLGSAKGKQPCCALPSARRQLHTPIQGVGEFRQISAMQIDIFPVSFQVGKAPLVQRDQGARTTGDKDVQKAQEPATKAYREMAADAAEFQASFPGRRLTQ